MSVGGGSSWAAESAAEGRWGVAPHNRRLLGGDFDLSAEENQVRANTHTKQKITRAPRPASPSGKFFWCCGTKAGVGDPVCCISVYTLSPTDALFTPPFIHAVAGVPFHGALRHHTVRNAPVPKTT